MTLEDPQKTTTEQSAELQHTSAQSASSPATLASSEDDIEKSMPLLEHINELRSRLVRCFIATALGFVACYGVADILFAELMKPLTLALPENSHLIFTALPEAFFTYLRVAFVAGLFLASPVLFYQIWAFIAPGLYEEEKRYAIPLAFFSATFFIGGAAFCFFVVFPFAFKFFMGFATTEIIPMPSVGDYLGFSLKLLIAFGLIFEMPLFTFFLARMGIVTPALMRRGRRYAILCIFITAAILTPPDVVSQLLMAGPMFLLYEFSILIAVAFGRKKRKIEPEDADNNAKDSSQQQNTATE